MFDLNDVDAILADLSKKREEFGIYAESQQPQPNTSFQSQPSFSPQRQPRVHFLSTSTPLQKNIQPQPSTSFQPQPSTSFQSIHTPVGTGTGKENNVFPLTIIKQQQKQKLPPVIELDAVNNEAEKRQRPEPSAPPMEVEEPLLETPDARLDFFRKNGAKMFIMSSPLFPDSIIFSSKTC